jgi:hypothetical protein
LFSFLSALFFLGVFWFTEMNVLDSFLILICPPISLVKLFFSQPLMIVAVSSPSVCRILLCIFCNAGLVIKTYFSLCLPWKVLICS